MINAKLLSASRSKAPAVYCSVSSPTSSHQREPLRIRKTSTSSCDLTEYRLRSPNIIQISASAINQNVGYVYTQSSGRCTEESQLTQVLNRQCRIRQTYYYLLRPGKIVPSWYADTLEHGHTNSFSLHLSSSAPLPSLALEKPC